MAKTNGENKDKKKKVESDSSLPPVRRAQSRVIKSAERIEKLAATTKRFKSDDMQGHLEDARRSLKAAAAILAELPDDAGSKGTRGVKLDVGQMVDIKEKARKTYDGLLEEDDLVGLEVTKVQGSRVCVVTGEGVKMFLPKGHVMPAQEANA